MPNTPCSPFSPFIFILNQLDAAAEAKLQETAEPPKRPRGRPPKVEEPPLLPGAYRHVLSDEDSEFDKQVLRSDEQHKAVILETLTPPEGLPAVIVPLADKHVCVYNSAVIGISKHKDYWEYHYAKGDLSKAQDKQISVFIRVTALGVVETVASAAHLKRHGVKGSFLDASNLSEADLATVKNALETALLESNK